MEITPEFVADLYDAAMDDEAWGGFAAKIACAVGVEGGAVLLIQDGAIIDMSTSDNIRGPSAGPYQQHFQDLDPWRRRAPLVPSGVIMLSSELFPERELIKTEFYNDFARLIGMFRPMNAYAAINGRASVALGVEQPFARRLLEPEDKPALARLLPYVLKVAELRLKLRAANLRADRNVSALDALAFGAVVCDAASRVIMINAAAEDLARNGSGVLLARGIITAQMGSEAQTLAHLINLAATGGSGASLRLTGRDGIAALFVLITPLPTRLGGQAPGRVLVAMRSAYDKAAFTEATLAAIFRLSPKQAAIALAIFNGQTPDQIAADHGLSISTVRSHLQEVFVRTGAETQRDLVRLLAALPPVR